LSVLYLTKFI